MQLKIQSLTFFYGNVCALQDVTFNAKEGEILGILGPNGSGKTTLLKCINKVLKSQSGEVLINGTELSLLNRKEIAKIIGVVPQMSKVFPFQVLEVVMMGRYPHIDALGSETQLDFEATRDAMTLTGIDYLSERYIDELSGGELQKVIIARALAQQPEILLLDEPISHLDINHQLEILDLIQKITHENQLTTLLVSHNLNMAARYCDKLLLLSSGKVYSIGSVEKVLTSETIKEVFQVDAEIRYSKQIQSYQIIPLKPI